jgi:hypothetical protein
MSTQERYSFYFYAASKRKAVGVVRLRNVSVRVPFSHWETAHEDMRLADIRANDK